MGPGLINSFEIKFKSAFRNLKSAILLCALLFALCSSASAQQPAKVPRIGYLAGASPSAIAFRTEAFRQGLRELGYVEGKNITIEYRYAEGNFRRQKELADRTGSSQRRCNGHERSGFDPCRQGSNRYDTHCHGSDSDPVGNGFIASLARPGGNITGLSTLAPEISGKQLELLKETVPRLSHVVVLGSSVNPGNVLVLKEMEAAAQAFSLKLQYRDILDRQGD